MHLVTTSLVLLCDRVTCSIEETVASACLNVAAAVAVTGPLFVVSHKQVEHYRSPVYDRVKRGDLSLLMVPTQPVVICGDVMVEFFNKPKMLAKVRSLFRVLFPGALSQ